MPEIPVALLHGVGLDASMWAPVRDALKRHSVALDLPGHGRQSALTLPVSLADLAADVLDRLPERSHLVGFSLGALIAQHIARFHPDRVATLTCVNSVCQRTEAESQAVMARLASAEHNFPATVQVSIDRWYTGTSVPADVVEATRRTLEANNVASFVHAYRVFATGDAVIGPELGRIQVPTLAVTGELDPGSTPDMTRRLAAAIPGAKSLVVPGARHMLPVQNADVLAGAINDFIQESEGERA
ncbi:alpha/beta fold hydrolase [Pseudarthrobacter sp. NamE5]|uniref:alpha/beta fold hydrolase n=1 Tax=Pseudarthrobacter sp. NamE5 TaxID=2576839 RepID=UPI00110B87F3|nr:alpha/beta fold hydrolase [Pseudarthrobacter sp. NamE5]TLM83743.1 alpha/beta fold hydrolase [Pseudarthrobacter sp. NamE5]